MMKEFIDLHCHYIPHIDDGARTLEDSNAILVALRQVGFACVCATPHMRPGMFDNDAPAIRNAFDNLQKDLALGPSLPELCLGAEHYFDDVVFRRIQTGHALLYPGNKALLLEFHERDFPLSIEQRLAEIRRSGVTPVIAHPERYQPIARNTETMEGLNDVGAKALLDLGALVGKYGRKAQRTAEALMERELYAAACSDAHRVEDVAAVAKGMEWIVKHYGDEELNSLLVEGPRMILQR